MPSRPNRSRPSTLATLMRAGIKACAWLGVGLVISVLVAWSIAYVRQGKGLGPPRTRVEAPLRWPTLVPGDWPKPDVRLDRKAPGEWIRMATRKIDEDEAPTDAVTFMLDTTHSARVLQWGWPRPAMQIRRVDAYIEIDAPKGSEAFRDAMNRRDLFNHGWQLAPPPIVLKKGEVVTIPLFPVWPGLAIDAILYAVLLWVASRVPVAIVRTGRRRRGCCATCGYRLEGLDTCPECGRKASGRAARARREGARPA